MKALLLGLLVEMAGVVVMARHGDFLQKGEAAWFAGSGVMAGLAFWWAAGWFMRRGLPPRQSGWIFWGMAVAVHAALLPILPGDDVWRYRWEGAIQWHGFNPYVLAPDAPMLAGLRDADWSKINHRDDPAIYPPLAELGFAGLAAGGVSVLGYKLLFMAANLGVSGILRRLLAGRGASPEGAAWYAWNPLAAYVCAGGAHFDVMMVLPFMGAVWCLDRLGARAGAEDAHGWGETALVWASALLLGVAIGVKVVPLVVVPAWFFALGWRRARWAWLAVVGVLPASAVVYGFPRVPVFAALGNFARGFRVNDSVWWVVDAVCRGGDGGRISAGEQAATVLACGALAVWWRHDWRRGLLWVLGAAVLLGPALHAWYIIWVLPVAVWRGAGARAWVVLSISLFLYFLLWEVNHASGRPWEEPLSLRLGIYLPPLAAAAWTLWSEHRRAGCRDAEAGKPC